MWVREEKKPNYILQKSLKVMSIYKKKFQNNLLFNYVINYFGKILKDVFNFFQKNFISNYVIIA